MRYSYIISYVAFNYVEPKKILFKKLKFELQLSKNIETRIKTTSYSKVDGSELILNTFFVKWIIQVIKYQISAIFPIFYTYKTVFKDLDRLLHLPDQ